MIAAKIKATRDATTVEMEDIDGTLTPVNRCDGIACLGGAAHDNEECYLLVKLMRALGLVYIEHQARI
jgi:formate dehydrogenase major subunit